MKLTQNGKRKVILVYAIKSCGELKYNSTYSLLRPWQLQAPGAYCIVGWVWRIHESVLGNNGCLFLEKYKTHGC